MKEGVPLAPLTTFRIGGPARTFVTIESEQQLHDAILAYRQDRDFSFAVLGGGSNLLVPDVGLSGLVIKMAIPGIDLEEADGRMRLVLGAGVSWDAAVDVATAASLWGIENLAGIPGTAGGAAVQNIGAYGAELADVFEWADTFNLATGESKRMTKAEASFAYRDSVFKQNRELVITRIAITLEKKGTPNLSYQDLRSAPVATPKEIAALVRSIRAHKFPDLTEEGTAGSFFKNPVVSSEQAVALGKQFLGLPQFPQANGDVKIPLAWILDHALGMKGFARGKARLFERQPLVIAAAYGAMAHDVEELACAVEKVVLATTHIHIEREVENFSARKLSTGRE